MMSPANFRQMLLDESCDPGTIQGYLRGNLFSSPVMSEMGAESWVGVFRDESQPRAQMILPYDDSHQLSSVTEHSVQFRAAVLQVMNYSTVEDRLRSLPGLRLPVHSNAIVMITTQLSGCSIVYQASQDGYPYVMLAHVKPDTVAGAAMEDELKRADPMFERELLSTRIYGRHEYRTLSANVIALLRRGNWTLYVQKLATPTMIVGVDKIPLFR